MSTDRELLEWAAKAAGIHPRKLSCGGPSGQVWIEENDRWEKGWNPLTDDGDAFRLGVKLDIFATPIFFHYRGLERFGRQDADDCAATRRAITRAAAEIGKGMP